MPFQLLILSCLALIGIVFFVRKASLTQDFSRLENMGAEFIAILSAISIGFWIGIAERQSERSEEATLLVRASASYAQSLIIDFRQSGATLLEPPPIRSPNILDTLLSSPRVFEFYGDGLVAVQNRYNEAITESAVNLQNECGVGDHFISFLISSFNSHIHEEHFGFTSSRLKEFQNEIGVVRCLRQRYQEIDEGRRALFDALCQVLDDDVSAVRNCHSSSIEAPSRLRDLLLELEFALQ